MLADGEKYKRTSLVRDVFINNLKGKLGEEVVKGRLAELVTAVDYEKRLLGGDGKVDFTLTSHLKIGIEVKVRHGIFDKVCWSISAEATQKNAVLLWILIQEQVHEAQSQYHLVLAGFLPTSMIKVRVGKIAFSIDQLLYSGGLQYYLNQLQSTSISKSHLPKNLNYKYNSNSTVTPYLSTPETNYIRYRDEDLNLLYIKQGDKSFLIEEYEAAITNYNQALKIQPNDADAYYKKSLARYHIGN